MPVPARSLPAAPNTADGTCDATTGIAATGYAAFAVAMLVGRLVGDRAVQRWGAARVARAGGLLAAAGVAVVVAATGPLGVAAGFAAVGVPSARCSRR